MNQEKEIWKDIKNYEGHYMVSNTGRVVSLKYGKKRILKNGYSENFYYTVALSTNNKPKTNKVHRLVASAFLGESDLFVNHKDGDKTNNHISNLEYVTCRDNTIHSKKSKNNISKYTGVTIDRKTLRWRARITIGDKRKHLGYFETEEEAYEAYVKALKENGIKSKYA